VSLDLQEERPYVHGVAVTVPTSDSDWRIFPPLLVGPVLSAALEVFVEVGYHGASVRDIARRAGLSVPGMYHHYATKQEMLTKIIDLRMEDLRWRSEAAQEEAGDDPVRRFELLIECLVLYHAYRRDLAFMGASEIRSLDRDNRKRILELRGEQQRMVDAAVCAAAADGRFATPYPRDAARAVVTMCTALPQWYRPEGPLTPEQIADRYLHLARATVQYRPRPRSR
jgi:AcrR family transcriptional regulator